MCCSNLAALHMTEALKKVSDLWLKVSAATVTGCFETVPVRLRRPASDKPLLFFSPLAALSSSSSPRSISDASRTASVRVSSWWPTAHAATPARCWASAPTTQLSPAMLTEPTQPSSDWTRGR